MADPPGLRWRDHLSVVDIVEFIWVLISMTDWRH